MFSLASHLSFIDEGKNERAPATGVPGHQPGEDLPSGTAAFLCVCMATEGQVDLDSSNI